MRRIFLSALLVAFTAGAGIASAQSLVGTITGTVADQQGALLPGVTVTLNGRTGTQTQVTDGNGEYRFIGLNPGNYTVKAELSGFRLRQEQSVDLGIGQTLDVKLVMVVGALTETVDVVASSVSVDTTSTKTDTNMSQDLLFSMPITHANPAVNLLDYSPGVNDGAAFGGDADTGNALMLDGVDTRDPEAGSAWTFFNYNIIDEVQVGSLGQPAEYGGFTGAIMNTITKSGGNRYSALAEYQYSSEDLSSNNVSDQVLALNATLASSPKILKLKDYTVQLGGPIKKDKLFFFGSAQRYNIQQYNPPIRTEVSPRFNVKLTSQVTANDNLVGSLQYDQYNQTGRAAAIPGYAISDQSQTHDQDSPEYIWNAQYRRVFGSSSFLEVKYTGWWGYYDLNPVSPEPTHYDGATNAYSGGAGWVGQFDRTRNQVNVSLSTYAEAAGRHNFKFGMEVERSTVRDRFAYSGATAQAPSGVFYYDYGGPYIAYGYSYDLKGRNKRESFYAQDQWKHGRLTVNGGLRFDNIRGEATDLGNDLYSTKSVGPRLGAAFDLTGNGTSVLRGFWGQMYEAAIFSSWSRAVPGLTPFNIYEVGPNWSSLTLIESSADKYSVGDNLKHPRVDEFNVAWEQQILGQFKFTATGIYRNWKNFINSVLPDARWTPFTFTNPKTNQPMTLYRWANPTSVPEFRIINTDQVTYNLSDGGTFEAPKAYRNYKGMMLVFQKALRNRWQAQISYVLSKTEGTINNNGFAAFAGSLFETPNSLINVDGPTPFDTRHEVKLFGAYQVPKVEVLVSGFWRYLSGTPYTSVSRMPGSRFDWTGAILVNLEPRGTYLNDDSTRVDLRLEKVFDVGINRFGLYADFTNLMNTGTVTSRVTRYPFETLTNPANGESVRVNFGDPRNMNRGRQITFGGRWSF